MTTKVDYTSTELPDDLESTFETALRRLRSEEPPIEEHIIGGSRRTGGVPFERFDPCQPGVRVSAAFWVSCASRAAPSRRTAARARRAIRQVSLQATAWRVLAM